MNKYILIIFGLASTISAQDNLAIIGGWFNLSQIKYNDESINDMVNIETLRRNNIGVETKFNNIIAGVGFVQRGYRYKIEGSSFNVEFNPPDINSPFNVLLFPLFLEFTLGTSLYGYEVFNLLNFYTLYVIDSDKDEIDLFGGLQIGFPIGGKIKASKLYFSSFDYDGENIEAKNMNICAGLLIGLNLSSSNTNFGFRASYYLGITDFKKSASSENNYKNRTLSLSVLLYL